MITFIMPSINRPTIARAIESLVKQTNPNWKLWVVYDGFWAEPPFKEDPRVQSMFFHPKIGTGNMAANVRKMAFPRVDTDWIGFLDDDDWLAENYVARFYEEVGKSPWLSLICFRMLYGDVIIPPMEVNQLPGIKNGQVGISLAIRKGFLYGPNAVFWSPSNTEDLELISQLITKGACSTITEDVLYYAAPRL